MYKRLAALAVITVILAGCTTPTAGLTHAEVTRWNDIAESTLENAQEVDLYLQEEHCFWGGCETIVLTLAYSTYDDVMADEAALVAIRELVYTAAPALDFEVRLSVTNYDSRQDELAKAVAAQTSDAVVDAEVSLRGLDVQLSGVKQVAAITMIVDHPDDASPEDVELAIEAVHADGAVRTQWASFDYLVPGTNDAGEPAYGDVDVREIDAFTRATFGDCLLQGNWLLDLSQTSMRVYAKDAELPACR